MDDGMLNGSIVGSLRLGRAAGREVVPVADGPELPSWMVDGAVARLARTVERFPHALVEPPHYGVIRVDEGGVWLKLDKHVDGLEEWDNELQWYEDHLGQDVWLDMDPAPDRDADKEASRQARMAHAAEALRRFPDVGAIFNPQWGSLFVPDHGLSELLGRNNWQLSHTGGGCMAWERPHDDGGWLWITYNDGGPGEWKDRSKKGWIVGRYSEDGDYWVCTKYGTLCQVFQAAALLPHPGEDQRTVGFLELGVLLGHDGLDNPED